MSGGGSVRTLLLRVGIVVIVLLGLCRWTSRGTRPAPADDTPSTRSAVGGMDAGAQQLSAPGDLSFYRTLGSGSGSAGTPTLNNNNKDTGGPPAATGSSSSGAYIVQVLATRDPGVARRTRDRLAAHGFPAVVLEDRTGSPSVYRVRAGRYLTRQEAEAAARVLRRNRFSPWVLQEGQ